MRLSLDILEATALISACNTHQSALELRIKSARKTNNFEELTSAAAEYADLNMARRKVENALSEATRVFNTSPRG